MPRNTKLSQEEIREQNRRNVLLCIKRHSGITKNEIAKKLKLSIPTVTTNINGLLEEGFVFEAGVAQSTGGRKPMTLEFNENARYSMGISMTAQKIKIRVVNLGQKLLIEQEFLYNQQGTLQENINEMQRYIESIINKMDVERKKFLGIGIALPGIVDEEAKVLLNAPTLGVKNYSFEMFNKALGIPVFLENEANVSALAEMRLNSFKSVHNIVYVSVTEGVGTGVIIYDKIYKSVNKKAGEFGHTRIASNNISCQCGRKDCWEVYGSKRALLKAYNSKFDSEITTLTEFFNRLRNCENEEVRLGMEKVLREYLMNLFVGVENIIMALSPEIIIIGGDLTPFRIDILEQLKSIYDLTADTIMYEKTKIIFSGLGNRSALIGATLLPMETLFHGNQRII